MMGGHCPLHRAMQYSANDNVNGVNTQELISVGGWRGGVPVGGTPLDSTRLTTSATQLNVKSSSACRPSCRPAMISSLRLRGKEELKSALMQSSAKNSNTIKHICHTVQTGHRADKARLQLISMYRDNSYLGFGYNVLGPMFLNHFLKEVTPLLGKFAFGNFNQ